MDHVKDSTTTTFRTTCHHEERTAVKRTPVGMIDLSARHFDSQINKKEDWCSFRVFMFDAVFVYC